ncbi:MAG: ABC transporter ATP-binding protein [bacterium]
MVELRDVSKVFFSGGSLKTALDKVNLTVERGEFVCLKGRSGAGKTTLLNLAGGLDAPTSGSASVLGIDARLYASQRMAELRNRRIGFVFQIFHLVPGDLFHNVSLPLQMRRMSRREQERRTMEVLERVGIEGLARQDIRTLSGGERQRAVFARALVKEPEIIFADEPFSNLDDITAGALIHLMEELHSNGKMIFLVTHSYEDRVQPTRTIFLEEGHLIKDEKTS